MSNPLMQKMGGSPAIGNINPQAIQSVKRMIGMLKTAQNPQAAIMQAAQQNPMLGNIVQMCNGRNPQEVFIEQCKQHGVNPDEAMQTIQQMLF